MQKKRTIESVFEEYRCNTSAKVMRETDKKMKQLERQFKNTYYHFLGDIIDKGYDVV